MRRQAGIGNFQLRHSCHCAPDTVESFPILVSKVLIGIKDFPTVQSDANIAKSTADLRVI